MPSPNRSEVWLADFGYTGKIRPCLILSIPPADEDRALATVVPHTTSRRESRFETLSAVRFLKPGAFDAQNLTTLSQSKLLQRLGTLPPDQLQEVEESVLRWLGFQSP